MTNTSDAHVVFWTQEKAEVPQILMNEQIVEVQKLKII